MLTRRLCIGLCPALLALSALASPAFADDDEREDKREREHRRPDQMRAAVERGEIKPLVEVLKLVQSRLPGEIVGVEAEFKDGRWTYEFRVLGSGGRLYEVEVNATTAEIGKIEEK